MDSPKLAEKTPRGQQQQCKRGSKQTPDHSDGEELSPSQILERVKPDRVTASKPEEDRRRRTIIVEKKNGSFGFTLQSYGIHYKKEQEIEMITYVDYVDYDGAAFRAGMREGDVILSINGHDMEKADHKTLVNFIKNCDARMRMVVLFEDCVRKVELHMRYIQLQRALQGKMAELERLCLRERELLAGKWKTHSLPARKKATASTSADSATTPTQGEGEDYTTGYCRPTVSTEDVARIQQQPQTQQLLLSYHYMDPRFRGYFLQHSPGGSSGECLWQPARNHNENSHRVLLTCEVQQPARHSASKGYHQTNGMAAAGSGGKSSSKSSSHGSRAQHQPTHATSHHLCNPCIQASNQDSSSLEAYDLASPCCNPHCVPSARRRTRHHKSKSSSKTQAQEQGKGWKESKSSRSSAQASSNHPPPPPQRGGGHRYLAFGAGLVSQCSLHSCTSSEMSCNPTGCASSAASYTTSLSNDTLYWDNEGPPNNQGTKSPAAKPDDYNYHHHHHHHHHHHQQQPQYATHSQHQFSSYNATKPAKSWDNLTTKAFGGYGFGYGYLDTTSAKAAGAVKANHTRTHSTKGNSNSGQGNRNNSDHRLQNVAVPAVNNLYSQNQNHHQHHHHHHHRYVQPNKSTDNLLLLPKYTDPTLSDSSLSCDCLDVTSPAGDSQRQRFFPPSNPGASTNGEQNFNNTYHPQGRAQGNQIQQKRQEGSSGEVTRL